jgi:hypothetical protein
VSAEGDYSAVADAQLDELEQVRTQICTTRYSTSSNSSSRLADSPVLLDGNHLVVAEAWNWL